MPSESSREIRTLRRLHQLMSQVNARTDLQELLQKVAEGVADVTGFQVAVISYLHPDSVMEVVAVAGDDDAKAALLGARTPLEHFDAEFALADEWGILRYVPHWRLPEEEVAGWVPDVEVLDVPDAWHPLDALFAPLSAPTGEVIGMLSVDLPRDGRLPGRFQREVLEMYVVQAGIAINNAQQRKRLVDQVRLAEAVHTIGHTTGRALDLGEVIDESLDPIVSGLRCHAAWIRAFEGEGERPGRGRGAIYPTDRPLVPPDEMTILARRVATHSWREQQAFVVSEKTSPRPDVVSDEEVGELLRFIARIGAHSLMLAPFGVGSECLGYMVLTRAEGDPAWSDAEVSAALDIGRDLGRAVQNARLFEREREVIKELQQLDVYKSELISTISHELKSPLTSVMFSLEFIQMSDPPPELEQWVTAIERNTGRMRTLVEDLLLLSKVRDPNQPLIPSPVNMAFLVGEAVELVRTQADKRGVDIRLSHGTEPVTAWGDPTELGRVVANLVGNALKYSPAGRTVHVSLEATGQQVRFSCADEGIGISPGDLDNLFTEFYRTNNPDALAEPGTGLGLTIVKRIVDRHDGIIVVTSELGIGSTFTVTLPAPPAAAELVS